MKTILRSVAALELLFIFPAVLFFTALFVRSLQPQQYEPSHTAQLIVDWYAARPHLGLWVLLVALPLAVAGIGSTTLIREWRHNQELREAALRTIGIVRSQATPVLIAGATAIAGAILAIVAHHVLIN